MHGRKADATFYPVVYGLEEGDDWNDEANWYKANPSLGHTISIERVREAYKNALENPAEENVFKQLRLNMWTNATVVWIPEHIYDRGNLPIDNGQPPSHRVAGTMGCGAGNSCDKERAPCPQTAPEASTAPFQP